MPSVWSSAGNVSRSSSELGTLKVEQQRMLRTNNQVTQSRTQEYDARSEETENDTQAVADKAAKQGSLERAKAAAELTKWASMISLVGTIVSAAAKPSAGSIGNVVSGLFDVMSKWLEADKVGNELDIVNKDLGRLKATKDKSALNAQAMDTTPAT